MSRDEKINFEVVVRMTGVVAMLLAGLFGGCQSANRRAADGTPAGMDIFLLAGQSNMAGRAPVEAFDRLVWPNLVCLAVGGAWVPAVEPLHHDKTRAGTGPGSTFGRIVADAYPGRKIGLVPAACGGTSITVWQPGAQHAQTGSHPYDDAVTQAKRAMADGRLRAILWIQGESDSTAERAPLYHERLVALIAGLRRDLNADDIPFIIGRRPKYAQSPDNPWRTMVDEAQRRAARELPRVHFVDMPVLTSLPDGIHADAASVREMGRRLAEAYLRIAAAED